jgi:hypothetical protein
MSDALERELEVGAGYSSPDLSEGERRNGRSFRALGVVLVTFVLAVGAYAIGFRGRGDMAQAKLGDQVAIKLLVPSVTAAPAALPFPAAGVTALPAAAAAGKTLGAPASAVQSLAPTPPQAVQTRRHIKPTENLADGNKCDDTEEEFEDMCYTKCSILLGKPTATRISAFSCCPTAQCGQIDGNPMDLEGVFNIQTASLIPCDGFDVSSTDGKSCPHGEGTCLQDEEQFVGACYKKCSSISPKYPFRMGPLTCCSSNSVIDCMNPFNMAAETSSDLDVGGGAGDGNPLTPGTGGHAPIVEGVTENTAAPTLASS